MFKLQEKSSARTRAEPSKQWRNFYRVYHVLNVGRMGIMFPGIHGGPDVFPSKDIADQHAIQFLGLLNLPGRWLMDHAGAYPEGDTPN